MSVTIHTLEILPPHEYLWLSDQQPFCPLDPFCHSHNVPLASLSPLRCPLLLLLPLYLNARGRRDESRRPRGAEPGSDLSSMRCAFLTNSNKGPGLSVDQDLFLSIGRRLADLERVDPLRFGRVVGELPPLDDSNY